jgi:hypothetical protein
MESVPIPLIILGGFLAFILFWMGIVWIIAQAAGWSQLAEKYPARQPWNPQCWPLQSALVRRWSQYRAVLKFCADEQALHISVLFPFSVAHKPLSIPWAEITGQKRRRFFYYGIQLTFQQTPKIPIYIRQGLADKLVAAANGQWHYTDAHSS